MDDEIIDSFFSELKELDETATVSTTISSPPISLPTEVTQVPGPPVVISRPPDIDMKMDTIKFAEPVISTLLQSSLPLSSTSSASSAASLLPTPIIPRQNKKFVRAGAGEIWVDDSLNEWPENDFRIFVGDLAKEITSEMLTKHFQHYKSFAKAKVIRTKHESKARGFGFVSFLDPMDCAKAIREQNGKYLGTRPMKISKSSWQDRDIKEVKKKESKKRRLQESLGLS